MADPVLTGVTLDRDSFGDPRFEYLAQLCGLADADHARGKMARLWAVCTARESDTPPLARIVVCLGPKGPEALVEAELGERMPDGLVRVKGCERHAWYQKDRRSEGGRARVATAARGQNGQLLPRERPADPANHQLAPAGDQQPPAQDQDQDQDPPRAISIAPATARRPPRPRALQDTPIPSLLPEAWKPSDTPKIRELERRASEQGGVLVAYAFDKFVERMNLEGRVSRSWDAEWCLFLTTEFPTPAQIRDVRGRADREASARAARDRERAEIVERDRRANAERSEARQVLAEFLKPEKATG